VLVVAGLNDIVDRKHPEWEGYRGPGDPAFERWLLAEYVALYDVMARENVPVVWLPPPCVDWDAGTGWGGFVGEDGDGERRRVRHNTVSIPDLRARRPFVLGDLEGQLCPGGRYDPNALGMEGSRPDGLHLRNDAAQVLAQRWLAPLLQRARR
jgi:hypothetical protein